jgi:hypothetical protein
MHPNFSFKNALMAGWVHNIKHFDTFHRSDYSLLQENGIETV